MDHAWDAGGLVVESQGGSRKSLILAFNHKLSQILPWDSDIDVQVSASTINFLASYYNMTLHTYKGRRYMLEINPHYANSSSTDYYNTIDGRYIDMDTGLFIDMTTLWPKEGSAVKLACKDHHEYEVRATRKLKITNRSEPSQIFVNRKGIYFPCEKASSKSNRSKYLITTHG